MYTHIHVLRSVWHTYVCIHIYTYTRSITYTELLPMNCLSSLSICYTAFSTEALLALVPHIPFPVSLILIYSLSFQSSCFSFSHLHSEFLCLDAHLLISCCPIQVLEILLAFQFLPNAVCMFFYNWWYCLTIPMMSPEKTWMIVFVCSPFLCTYCQ